MNMPMAVKVVLFFLLQYNLEHVDHIRNLFSTHITVTMVTVAYVMQIRTLKGYPSDIMTGVRNKDNIYHTLIGKSIPNSA